MQEKHWTHNAEHFLFYCYWAVKRFQIWWGISGGRMWCRSPTFSHIYQSVGSGELGRLRFTKHKLTKNVWFIWLDTQKRTKPFIAVCLRDFPFLFSLWSIWRSAYCGRSFQFLTTFLFESLCQHSWVVNFFFFSDRQINTQCMVNKPRAGAEVYVAESLSLNARPIAATIIQASGQGRMLECGWERGQARAPLRPQLFPLMPCQHPVLCPLPKICPSAHPLRVTACSDAPTSLGKNLPAYKSVGGPGFLK